MKYSLIEISDLALIIRGMFPINVETMGIISIQIYYCYKQGKNERRTKVPRVIVIC